MAGVDIRLPRVVDEWLYRRAFDHRVRAESWQLVAHLVRPQPGVPTMELSRALDRAAEVWDLRGRPAAGHVLRDLRAAQGRGFAARVAYWSRAPETTLFTMMEETDRLDRLFDGAAMVARNEGRIARAISAALFTPVAVSAALVFLLVLLGMNLFPELARLADPSGWPPHARILAGVSGFLVNHGLWLIPGALALRVLAGWLQRHWTGRGRVTADRVPPFSFTRLRTGAAFLFTVTELAAMDAELNTGRFARLAREAATEYERDRIGAVAAGVVHANPGRAALDAGLKWPAVEMSAVLDAFAGQGRWAAPFRAFLVAWVEEAERQAETMAAKLSLALLAAITGIVSALVLTVFDIARQAGGL